MRSAHESSGFERLMAWSAVVLPFAVACSRASSGSQWRSDPASLRDLGLVAMGVGGAVSTALTQIAALLPLGSRAFRASLVAAACLAVACWALFAFGRRLLAIGGCGGRMGALLSAIATVTAGLSASWQIEATVGGGAMPAVALVSLGLLLTMRLTEEGAPTLTPAASRGWLQLAIIAGAALGENLPAGIALIVVAAATAFTSGKPPHVRLLPGMAALTVLVCGVLQAPLLLRPLAPRSLSDAGRALSGASLDSLGAAATREAALHAWLNEVGVVALCLAGLGLIIGLSDSKRRAWMTPLVALPLIDLLYPLAATSRMQADPLAALRCLALATLAIAAASGVAYAATTLRRLDVPMARPASVLLVVFHATVVAVTCEEATFESDRSEHVAAEEWTDVALGSLPPRSAVLVRSPQLAWRLWAAQLLEGRRPDVLVIAAPLLRSGAATGHVLDREPRSTQLLRDLALTGQASELALSELADNRSLHVEFDPRWSKRLIHHLTLDGAWLRYSAQALGPSERKIAAQHALAQEGRIGSGVRRGQAPDSGSEQIIVRTLKEHVTTLSLLGMGDAANSLLDGIAAFTPDDPFVTGAKLRLAHDARRSKRRSVELRDLLRYGPDT